MKKLFLLMATIAFISCNTQKLEADKIIEENKFLIGTWTGEGKFLDVKVDEELGPVPIILQIFSDQSIKAKIGEAIVEDISISKAKYGVEIKGVLASDIMQGKETEKKHLIILFLIPKDADSSLNYCAANFHLKSNFNFDATMRVGGVKLQKALVD